MPQVRQGLRTARPENGRVKAHLAVCENCGQYIRKNAVVDGWTSWFHISSGLGACSKKLLRWIDS